MAKSELLPMLTPLYNKYKNMNFSESTTEAVGKKELEELFNIASQDKKLLALASLSTKRITHKGIDLSIDSRGIYKSLPDYSETGKPREEIRDLSKIIEGSFPQYINAKDLREGLLDYIKNAPFEVNYS